MTRVSDRTRPMIERVECARHAYRQAQAAYVQAADKWDRTGDPEDGQLYREAMAARNLAWQAYWRAAASPLLS